MPSGLPARVVVVCSLFFGVTIFAPAARAERRQVAVIDLSGDEKTTKLAADLNPILVGHPDLQPIKDATIPPELYGDFIDEDLDEIKSASNAKDTAQGSLANYRFDVASVNASNGQDELRRVTPSLPVILLYAQLSFLRGQALLGIQAADAPYQFALAYRLDPSFVPDAARYLPDVVQAYEAAKKRWSGKGRLQIAGHGRLWVDGKDAGRAPIEIEVDAGPHVIWLTGVDRFTAGVQTPVVEAGKTVKVEIADQPTDQLTKVRRARAALRYAPDSAARGAAMKALASLVAFEHALLLSTANGTVIVQRWNAGTREQIAVGLEPGFSSLEEWKGGKIDRLLARFAPPKKIKPKEEEPTPLVDDPRWYQKRKWQATLAAGIVAAIVGGYYIYKAATDDDAHLDPGIDPVGRIRW